MKTLAAAAGGLNLPTLPVTAAYVRTCDGDVTDGKTAGIGPRTPSRPVTTARRSRGVRRTEPRAGAHPAAPRPARLETGGQRGRAGLETGRTVPTPRGTASGEPASQRAPRPSQVASPRPAWEGPSGPDFLRRAHRIQGPEQVYVITSAAPRRPNR